ncbi:MAG: lysoplasmalogenase [Acidimicrobiales bacterium]
MNVTSWLLVAVFGAVAMVDWIAVARRSKPLEYVCKPGCMVVLIAAAVVMDPSDPTARAWLVAALALSTVGDVFLMLRPTAFATQASRQFVAGLASFLLAHVAYIAGFQVDGTELVPLGFPAAVLLVALVGRPLIASARRSEPELVGPVAAYVVVIAVMVATAIGTGDWRAGVGAVVFATSDSLIARERFVAATRWGPLAIIVTYHIAQALLLLSFA